MFYGCESHACWLFFQWISFNQKFYFWICDEQIPSPNSHSKPLCSQSLKTGVRLLSAFSKYLKLDDAVKYIWFTQLTITNTDSSLLIINQIALVWYGSNVMFITKAVIKPLFVFIFICEWKNSYILNKWCCHGFQWHIVVMQFTIQANLCSVTVAVMEPRFCLSSTPVIGKECLWVPVSD